MGPDEIGTVAGLSSSVRLRTIQPERWKSSIRVALRWVLDFAVDQVLAFRLHRHNLTHRLPPESLVTAAAGCGIQETPLGSADAAFVTRVEGLTPEAMQQARLDARSLVALWSVRGAPYVVPAADIGVFTIGALPVDQTSFKQTLGGWANALEDAGLDPFRVLDDMASAASEVLDGQAMDVNDLRDRVYAGVEALSRVKRPDFTHADMPEPLFRALGTCGAVCIVAGRGTNAELARTDQWLPAFPDVPDPGPARAELARRFLHCYGPATPRQFAEWTQRSLSDAKDAFSIIGEELIEVRCDGEEAFLHRDDEPDLSSPPQPTGLRLLPLQDPYLQQRDRAKLLPDEKHRREMWRPVRGPGAVVVNGAIVGTWRARTKGKRLALTLQPFAALSRDVQDEIETEARLIAPFRGCETVEVNLD